jgi:hypothetical protein
MWLAERDRKATRCLGDVGTETSPPDGSYVWLATLLCTKIVAKAKEVTMGRQIQRNLLTKA